MKIVLLPGLDGTGILFGPFLDRLPAPLSPIVVTYPPDRELGYDELLEIVLRHIPAGEPFVLLGESFSGPLALMAAATRPAGLRGVVLCATFVQNPTWIRLPWLARLVRPFAFRLYPHFSARGAQRAGRRQARRLSGARSICRARATWWSRGATCARCASFCPRCRW